MGTKESRVVGGIVLLSIGVAIIVHTFTAPDSYYAPIILLGVGLALVVRQYLAAAERRRTPIGGVALLVIGVASLVDSLASSNIIATTVKAVAPLVLPLLLVALGLRLIFGE
ncbi:MAG: hypothetical protein PHN82_00605 [bacterium]|nr:hypothetical protein [bacterium]